MNPSRVTFGVTCIDLYQSSHRPGAASRVEWRAAAGLPHNKVGGSLYAIAAVSGLSRRSVIGPPSRRRLRPPRRFRSVLASHRTCTSLQSCPRNHQLVPASAGSGHQSPGSYMPVWLSSPEADCIDLHQALRLPHAGKRLKSLAVLALPMQYIITLTGDSLAIMGTCTWVFHLGTSNPSSRDMRHALPR
jgi:hypothetical protein